MTVNMASTTKRNDHKMMLRLIRLMMVQGCPVVARSALVFLWCGQDSSIHRTMNSPMRRPDCARHLSVFSFGYFAGSLQEMVKSDVDHIVLRNVLTASIGEVGAQHVQLGARGRVDVQADMRTLGAFFFHNASTDG